jgi:hypothetical protein
MNGPSNIKIQKAGAEEIGNAHVCSPAADLGRSPLVVYAFSGYRCWGRKQEGFLQGILRGLRCAWLWGSLLLHQSMGAEAWA